MFGSAVQCLQMINHGMIWSRTLRRSLVRPSCPIRVSRARLESTKPPTTATEEAQHTKRVDRVLSRRMGHLLMPDAVLH